VQTQSWRSTEIYSQMNAKIESALKGIVQAGNSIKKSYDQLKTKKPAEALDQYTKNLQTLATQFQKVEAQQTKILAKAERERKKILKAQQNLRNKIAAGNKKRSKEVSDFEKRQLDRRAAYYKKKEKEKLDASKKAEREKTAEVKRQQREREKAEKRRDFRGGFRSQFTPRAIGGAIGSLTKYLGIYQLLNTAVAGFNELTIGSVKQAIKFEKSLADLSAVAGATNEEVSRLSKNALDVAGSTKFTAEEIVSLQTELAKLGFSANDIVESTSAIAQAAQALNSPLDQTALLIGKVRNQFGLMVEQTTQIADTLVTAVNESALSMDSFATAIQYVGPIAAQLGLDLQQTAGAMAVLADNGFTASRIGTGLRGILTELGKTGGDAESQLKKLAEAHINLAEAADLVGKRNAAQLITLLENLDAIEESNTKYYQQGRALESSAKQIDTFSGQLDILTAAWRRYQVGLGESIIQSNIILNVLEELAPKAAQAVRGFERINEIGFSAFNEGVENIVGGVDEFDEVLRLAGVSIDEYDKALEVLQTSRLGKGKGLISNTKEYNEAVRVFDLIEGLGKQIQIAVKAKQDDIDITKGQEFANKVYGKSVESLIKKSAQGINVNQEIAEEYANLGYAIDVLDKKIETATGSRLTQLKAEKAVYEQMRNQLNNSLLDEEEILEARKKQQASALKLRLDEIKRTTKEEVDFINERARVETALAKTAAERADIEAERTQLVSDAYGRQAEEIRGLSNEFDTQIDKIERAALASDDLAKILTSDVIKDVQKATADYTKEISDLEEKLRSNQISQEEYNAARDLQYETLKANIEAFKQLGDISPEVAAYFDELAKKALEAGYAIGESAEISKKNWDDFVRDFEENKLEFLEDAIKRTANVLGEFSDTQLENTKNRIASELELIKSRYETEDYLAKQQFENGLINEEQYRRKQQQLRKKQVAEENKLAKQLFEAERKQERQDAKINAAVATAEIIIDAINDYGFPLGLGVGAALSSVVAAELAGQLSAINQRKFYPKKFAEGGMVQGPSHEQGGVPFTVKGQSGYEMEGGEFIVNKKASSLHRELLESINNSTKFANGGVVNNTIVKGNVGGESVNYLKAIAEATTATAIQSSKPVRAFVTSTDLKKDETARRIKENNTTI